MIGAKLKNRTPKSTPADAMNKRRRGVSRAGRGARRAIRKTMIRGLCYNSLQTRMRVAKGWEELR